MEGGLRSDHCQLRRRPGGGGSPESGPDPYDRGGRKHGGAVHVLRKPACRPGDHRRSAGRIQADLRREAGGQRARRRRGERAGSDDAGRLRCHGEKGADTKENGRRCDRPELHRHVHHQKNFQKTGKPCHETELPSFSCSFFSRFDTAILEMP